MSRVEEALDKMISLLEHIGFSQKEAIKLVNEDIDKAKKEIDDYWRWVDQRIDLHVENRGGR